VNTPLEFYKQLRCPSCTGPLTPDTKGGAVNCESCAGSYPIVDGIPRFVSQEHLASFGLQWNKYEVAHDDEDRDTFQAKTGFRLDELQGTRILDAGCGGGRYSKICGAAGAEVLAADHSNAVEKASALCGHLSNVHFLQADLKRLPFAAQTFDYVFSIGVMHHDADTRAVFDAVAKMVKPGGRFAVWLYRQNQWWQEAINDALRKRTVGMQAERLERWCRRGAWLGGLPIAGKTLNKLANFSNHPCWENRVCDTFDWYAPEYQHHHTEGELASWFREAGFGDLIVLPPEKTGRFYRWTYRRNLLIGSGVNIQGTRQQ
jgi:SAM-dependent methyltransferase